MKLVRLSVLSVLCISLIARAQAQTIRPAQANIYLLKTTGELLWYKDVNQNGMNGKCGEHGWDANSGMQIGCGFGDYKQVFSGGNGVVYAIKNTGELLWYKDLHQNGTNGKCGEHGWDVNSGAQVGCGWGGFKQVFSGGNGVIYAIKNTGELFWYKDLQQNGTNGKCGERGWHPNSGTQIGCGWADYKQVFSGGNGVIYAIKNTGELLWYKDLQQNGTNGKCGERGWDANSGIQVGCGWGDFKQVFSSRNGIIYAIKNTGELLWYKDLIKNGANGKCGEHGWDTNSGSQIGCGWNSFR